MDTNITKKAIREAISILGPQRQAAEMLSEKTGESIKQGNLSYWMKTGHITPKYALPLAELSGVPASRLRPDIHFSESESVEAA